MGELDKNKRKLAVVIPVFNDWQSLLRLIREMDDMAAGVDRTEIDLLIVDDGSTAGLDTASLESGSLAHLASVRLIQLECNLGHQRAIAIGLSAAAKQNYRVVAIMDADGEDRPKDLHALLKTFDATDADVVVAERARRSEGSLFGLFYHVYRLLFRVLTGRSIRFGNFSVLSGQAVRRLIYMPELWNNFPAAVLKSRVTLCTLPTERGRRFSGRSRMGLSGLVSHGFSAISVDSERVFARVMIFTAIVGLLTLVAASSLVWIRLATELAIPGWTSVTLGILAVFFSQVLFFFLLSIFLLLQSRSTPVLPTAEVAGFYIRNTMDLCARD